VTDAGGPAAEAEGPPVASQTGAAYSDLDLHSMLHAVAAGRLPVEHALRSLSLLQVAQLGEFARLDMGRHARKGVPEVVYAPRKTDAALVAIMGHFVAASGLALASRVSVAQAGLVRASLAAGPASGTGGAGSDGRAITVRYDPESGLLEVTSAGYAPPTGGGLVGVLTGGTSDIPVAEEAALVLTHMGCTVARAYDVGVAGVHRLLDPLAAMIGDGAVALVVVAGMEGALPSVVAGLVDVPVIGVPTSTGYGFGGDGIAALSSILQSCSPGLVAVNIDNGVGAGAAAGLIARARRA
jgi:NCAIR mutase (PurE)-related protein